MNKTPKIGNVVTFSLFKHFNMDPNRVITKVGYHCLNSDTWTAWFRMDDNSDLAMIIKWNEKENKWEPIN